MGDSDYRLAESNVTEEARSYFPDGRMGESTSANRNREASDRYKVVKELASRRLFLFAVQEFQYRKTDAICGNSNLLFPYNPTMAEMHPRIVKNGDTPIIRGHTPQIGPGFPMRSGLHYSTTNRRKFYKMRKDIANGRICEVPVDCLSDGGEFFFGPKPTDIEKLQEMAISTDKRPTRGGRWVNYLPLMSITSD